MFGLIPPEFIKYAVHFVPIMLMSGTCTEKINAPFNASDVIKWKQILSFITSVYNNARFNIYYHCQRVS